MSQPHLLLSQVYFRLGDEERARKEKELSLKLRRENPTVLEAVQGRNFPGQKPRDSSATRRGTY